MEGFLKMGRGSFGIFCKMAAFLVAGAGCDDGGENASAGMKEVRSELARETSEISRQDLDAVVIGQYDLALDVLRHGAEQIGGKNAMVSALSLQSALAMVWAGANGRTASEMASALHFGDSSHAALNKIDAVLTARNLEPQKWEDGTLEYDATIVRNANAVYGSNRHTWNPAWLDILARNYGAGIRTMDFGRPEEARLYINRQVSEVTAGRIPELIPQGAVTVSTELVLTNAIYFKAAWNDHFERFASVMPFTLGDGERKKVEYVGTQAPFPQYKGEKFRAVSVPLRSHDFNVLFVLPDAGQFEAVESGLTGDVVFDVVTHVMPSEILDFRVPSLEFETSLVMRDMLKALGMSQAFSSEADFSGMIVESNGLVLSEVFHKTYFGLDETGVEAAAATAAVMDEGASPEEPVPFVLNRPFFFVVYESETLSPLFFGRVLDPTLK